MRTIRNKEEWTNVIANIHEWARSKKRRHFSDRFYKTLFFWSENRFFTVFCLLFHFTIFCLLTYWLMVD